MALLILIAALWIVVLAPGFIRRRHERHSVGSIDHFHHQLHLLERTGPKLVAPAYRLQSVESTTGVAVGASGYPAVTSMPGRPNLVLLKPVADDDFEPDGVVDDAAGGHYRRVEAPVPPPLPPPPTTVRMGDPDRFRRHQQAKRRRDILALTLGTTMVTGILGFVPSLQILWVATAVGGLALVAYVALMVYAQSLVGPSTNRARRPVPAGADRSPARAGFPGAWDEAPDDDDGYQQPARVASGR